MSIRDPLFGLAAVALSAVAPLAAQAQPFVFAPPASLSPGATYRIVFVSTLTTPATNSSIAFYNNLVNTEGQTMLPSISTLWSVIGSTATVDAVTNDSCGTTCDANDALFLVTGTKIANSTNSFFNGGILSNVTTQANGNTFSNYVWTGSTPAGVGAPGYQLGSASTVYAGQPAWGPGYTLQVTTYPGSTSHNLYAISGELSVPGVAVPEPESAALLGFGAFAAMLAVRRRKQQG